MKVQIRIQWYNKRYSIYNLHSIVTNISVLVLNIRACSLQIAAVVHPFLAGRFLYTFCGPSRKIYAESDKTQKCEPIIRDTRCETLSVLSMRTRDNVWYIGGSSEATTCLLTRGSAVTKQKQQWQFSVNTKQASFFPFPVWPLEKKILYLTAGSSTPGYLILLYLRKVISRCHSDTMKPETLVFPTYSKCKCTNTERGDKGKLRGEGLWDRWFHRMTSRLCTVMMMKGNL